MKVKLFLSIGSGAVRSETVELEDYIDLENWEKLSDSEKKDRLAEIAEDWSNQYIDLGYELID